MESEDAKKALEQMNGFELAGRPMKVGQVTERADAQAMGAANAQGHNQVGSLSTSILLSSELMLIVQTGSRL